MVNIILIVSFEVFVASESEESFLWDVTLCCVRGQEPLAKQWSITSQKTRILLVILCD